MSSLDKAVKELTQVLTETRKNQTSPYDTQAEVIRVDGDTAWVHIPGGVDETPVRLTMNAQAGDIVQVRVSGGNAWLQGNATSPPTDDTRANQAMEVSEISLKAAESAVKDAIRASEAAAQAEETAKGVEGIAENAKDSADSAKTSADTAFKQLSVVEDIVGVLDLIAKNGDYDLTQDTEVVPDKWYFTQVSASPPEYAVAEVATTYELTEDTEIDPSKTYYTRSGTAPDYVYTPVENPVPEDLGTYYEAFRNPSEQGLYELTGIDQSIQNYVSSHLVLTGNTLSLKTDGSDYRLDLTAGGMQVIGADGNPIATYGTETVVGKQDDFHIKMDGNELGFYKGAYRIAYMSGEKLYIPQSVVLQQMDVGLPYGYIDPATQEQVGFGQWSWKLHLNNENPPRNNLNLKWIG